MNNALCLAEGVNFCQQIAVSSQAIPSTAKLNHSASRPAQQIREGFAKACMFRWRSRTLALNGLTEQTKSDRGQERKHAKQPDQRQWTSGLWQLSWRGRRGCCGGRRRYYQNGP